MILSPTILQSEPAPLQINCKFLTKWGVVSKFYIFYLLIFECSTPTPHTHTHLQIPTLPPTYSPLHPTFPPLFNIFSPPTIIFTHIFYPVPPYTIYFPLFPPTINVVSQFSLELPMQHMKNKILFALCDY